MEEGIVGECNSSAAASSLADRHEHRSYRGLPPRGTAMSLPPADVISLYPPVTLKHTP